MLENIIFILYQPQDVVNVGGVARAMSNFGLRRLRLVEPAAFDAGRVAGIAHQAEAVIAGIERYPDLTAALADCGLVVATTGRARRVRYTRQSPRTAAPTVLAAAQPGAPVAVLFGREDTGLPNEALSSAHLLVTIPTDPAHHSLNLAQAALVIAYELWLAAQAAPRDRPAAPVPALGAAREEMFAALDALLEGPGGRPAAHRAHDLESLRAVLLRAVPRADEAARLTDLFRRLARAPGAPPPSGV
jgi:tRNA/rRNA methyltransferase/tRNA (cytidine32/uridine32-2'-O)-methyltransferase